MINRTRALPQERLTLSQLQARERERLSRPSFRVQPICPGGTVVCCASGPSLHKEDCEYAFSKGATLIAVNDAYLYAPFATALMASDFAWWRHKKPDFAGLKFSLDPEAAKIDGVIVLRRTGESGLETDPTGLKSGRNSGAAAVNLAVHFGAARILLLGYDMAARNERQSHFFGAHKFPLRGSSPYGLFRQMFGEMVKPLKALNVEVINCSRQTDLRCFPRQPLREALP